MSESPHKSGDIILSISSNVGFGVFIPGGKEGLEKWAESNAKSIKPCAHTIKETEEYLASMYDAVQLETDNDQLKNFELNVIMNQPEHKPAPPVDTSDAEIERFMDESASHSETIREEIRNFSSKHFGINARGYYLPHTQRNEAFYESVYKENARQTGLKFASKEVETDYFTVYIFFEETTETINASAGLDLLRKLLIYQGVTQKDIDELTPRFITYASLSKGIQNT